VKEFYLVNFKNNISFLANYQLIKKSCNIYRKESWVDLWEFCFGMGRFGGFRGNSEIF
jgi:hypothetical protein